MQEKTLQEYLEDISQEYTNELYLNIEKQIPKKNKKENICIDISNKVFDRFYELEDEDIEILRQILKENENVEINDNLKDTFVLCDKYKDNKKYIPLEIQKAINTDLYTKHHELNKEMAIDFYITINGIIEVDKLLELLKESKVDVSKEELLEKAKKTFAVKNNVVYLNQEIEGLNEGGEFIKSKNELKYKVYSLDEISDELKNISNSNRTLIRKLNKNKKISPATIGLIHLYSLITSDIKDLIKEPLENDNIKLTSKEGKDLLEDITGIIKNMPKWLYNGYKSKEEFLQANSKEYFDALPENERREMYYYYYVLINGMLKVNKLLDLLEKNNIETTTKEIENFFNRLDDFSIIDNYICHYNLLNNEELKQALLIEKMKTEYKVIDNIQVLERTIENDKEKVKIICNKYNLSEENIGEIYLYILYGFFNKELLKEITEENKEYQMSNKTLDTLYEELYIASKDIISWRLNGYTKSEVIQMPSTTKKEKIGRNDLCSCGSGKKYKKCCGMN